MPNVQFPRESICTRSLSERENRVHIGGDAVHPDHPAPPIAPAAQRVVEETATRLASARERGASRVLAFGAHAIKNGLGPVLIRLMEEGWFTHLATNGAGIIHDWEIAYQGKTSEHVARNVAHGQFGLWHETGLFLNLALAVGAYRGLGYGESVGAMVADEGIQLPSIDDLRHAGASGDDVARSAAAWDLLGVMGRTNTSGGRLSIPHQWKSYGVQAASYRLGVPLTGHPMFGHDIIYCHPANSGAAVGRTAERDFLSFVESIAGLDHGVYLSVGSAVMSPMIFEKSLSMARNLAHQKGGTIEHHSIVVVDLQESRWDWSTGEPPEHHPDYYLRFYKTFHRMGGSLCYAAADNRVFLPNLLKALG
jgi:hypothetical protein